MVRGTVHKEGDRILIEVSPEDAEAAGLEDGQELELNLLNELGSSLDPRIRAIATRIIREHREALDYLAQ